MGCSIHACQAVAELVQHSGELRSLHLYNNMSGDEGAAAIAQVTDVINDCSCMDQPEESATTPQA